MIRTTFQRTARLIPITFLLALGACSAGPDFVRPDPPQATQYTVGPTAVSSANADAGTPGAWWTALQSDALNALVKEGLSHNPDLQSAEASVQSASALLRAQIGQSTAPQVQLESQYAQQRAIGLPTLGPPTSTYDVYAATITAQYDLDLFGAIRRANEAASAHLEVNRYELQAARQTLVANLVATAIRSAALRQQVQACQEAIAAARQQREWATRRHQLGALSRTDFNDAERAYQDAAQQLPALQAQWQRSRHALAVLLGRAPQDAPVDLDFSTLQVPDRVPLEVPSELVHRRPDIGVAEASLHEATARLGLATANLYPQIRLRASYGSESFNADQFLQSATTVWSLAAGLVQPLFQGGALRAQKGAAEAALSSAAERYRGTVLRAFQNVADALRTLESDAQALQDIDAAQQAANSALEDTRRRAALGASHRGEVARREAQWQQERIRWIGASSTRLIDTAALFQATGAPVDPDCVQANACSTTSLVNVGTKVSMKL